MQALTRFLFLVSLSVFSSTACLAHQRSESHSEWSWRDDTVVVTFSMRYDYAQSMVSASEDTTSSIQNILTFSLKINGEPCSLESPFSVYSQSNAYITAEGRYICSEGKNVEVGFDPIFRIAPTHIHYARILLGERPEEVVLTRTRQSYSYSTSNDELHGFNSSWRIFASYVASGVAHILSGPDHLVFLIGLTLLAANQRELLWLVTGFTIGHSVSLALATLKIAQPNETLIEAFIGLTILLTAVDAAGKRAGAPLPLSAYALTALLFVATVLTFLSGQFQNAYGVGGIALFSALYIRYVSGKPEANFNRLMLTVLFGLIHGFGFAGGLLHADFPREEILVVLAGFNLGVEIGQIATLAVFAMLIYLASLLRRPKWMCIGENCAITLLGLLGCFWFVSRVAI